MLKAIEAVFDGKTFVPTGPVDLPTGTKVTVDVPDHAPGMSVGPPPPPMTGEERAEWEEILAKIRSAELPCATADEAVAAMRRSSWAPPGEEP